MKKKLVLITFLSCFFPVSTLALEVTTHQLLNSAITTQSFSEVENFSLDLYLKDRLDISAGISAQIKYGANSNVSTRVANGGLYEDIPPNTIVPYRRSFNHFHNPLIGNLAEAGYSPAEFLDWGISAVAWAQKPVGTQIAQDNYSWHDVRASFLRAMTASTNELREENFAVMFRGLGQQMHLIQDMSVPEHARDDGHVLPAYEKYIEKHYLKSTPLPSGIYPDLSLLKRKSVFDSQADVPIANLFDVNLYTGENPEATMKNIGGKYLIGLSEYTNANFLSPDTNFTKEFPYPSKNDSCVTLEDVEIDDPVHPGGLVKRPYYRKSGCGDSGYLLAGKGYFNIYLNPDDPSDGIASLPPMDDNVYADYAERLLPRAIGYSATLLYYFFRGDITLEKAPGQDNYYVIRNNTDELMDGSFSLYYDDSQDERFQCWSETMIIEPNGKSAPFTFEKPDQAAEPDRFILVFSGTLGFETDAVAGAIIKLPLWQEEWNNGKSGNHSWLFTDDQLAGQNSDNGVTFNYFLNDSLVKENIRYAGSSVARTNQTTISRAYIDPNGGPVPYCLSDLPGAYCFADDFSDSFPIPIKQDTVISVKVDELSLNTDITIPDGCPDAGARGGFQGIYFTFNNGKGIGLSTLGQQFPYPDSFNLPLDGGTKSFLPASIFKNAGVSVNDSLELNSVSIEQQLYNTCRDYPPQVTHKQKMVIDYIRIQ